MKSLITEIFLTGGREIEVLAINNNNITTASVPTIGKLIGTSFCNIQRLSLAGNPLKDSFAKGFIRYWRNNDSIFEIDLANCQIGFNGMKSLVRVLKFNVSVLQLHLEPPAANIDHNAPPPGLASFEVYSSRLFSTTKAGRRMKPKAKHNIMRFTRLADRCINRNLRIRYARARCADILRKGAYPVRLNVARLTVLGSGSSGKTGLAHSLIKKVPFYYPDHQPTVSLATAVLQTFQSESVLFDDMIKNISPEVKLDKKEKYYARNGSMPFDLPIKKDEVALARRKQSKVPIEDNFQIWRAKKKNFEGLLARCVHREAAEAAESAGPEPDDTLEEAGKNLYNNPESINDRIHDVAKLFNLTSDEEDSRSKLLPGKPLDQLSEASWGVEDHVDVGATLNAAVNTNEEVQRLSFLFDAVETEVTYTEDKKEWNDENPTIASQPSNNGKPKLKRGESGTSNAQMKYGNYKKNPNGPQRFPQLGFGGPANGLKITTKEAKNKDTMFNNPMVNERTIRDIANTDLLLRSYFADTCLFNLFDVGGSVVSEMLAKFAIFNQGINALVIDLGRTSKASLEQGDVIRGELTAWYRCIELFGGENAATIVVGTKLDEVEHLAEATYLFGAPPPRKKRKDYNPDGVKAIGKILKSIDRDFIQLVVREDNPQFMRNVDLELNFFPLDNYTQRGIEPIKSNCEKYARDLSADTRNYVPLRWVKLLELAFERYNANPTVEYKLEMKVLVKLAVSLGFSCKAEIFQCLERFDELGFWFFKSYNHELCNWLILDTVPLFKSIMRFTQKHTFNIRNPPPPTKFEEHFGNDLVLLRNHGLLSKQLFKALWQGDKQKADLNFGASWLKQHYFMTEFRLDGQNYFLFPSFLRDASYFQQQNSQMVPGIRESFYFGLTFTKTGYLPPGLIPRLVCILIGFQENSFDSLAPLSQQKNRVSPAFDLFSVANTSSKIYLTKNKIRIKFGGQLISMTREGNELIFGLTDSGSAGKIVLVIHSILSKLNLDVFNGRIGWDLIFFQGKAGSKILNGRPPHFNNNNNGQDGQTRTMFAESTHYTHSVDESSYYREDPDDNMVNYESDNENEQLGVSVTGRRLRVSFNDARSKKMFPFFQNESNGYEDLYELWQGARTTAEAIEKFAYIPMTQSVEEYCNTMKQKYFSNSF